MARKRPVHSQRGRARQDQRSSSSRRVTPACAAQRDYQLCRDARESRRSARPILLGAVRRSDCTSPPRVSIDHENPQTGRRTWVDNERQQRTGAMVPKDLSSTKNRKKLGKKSFALPGKRKYPI